MYKIGWTKKDCAVLFMPYASEYSMAANFKSKSNNIKWQTQQKKNKIAVSSYKI